MITGRKVIPRKIRTTPPETLVARLSQPHLIPHKDNIFQEIDHNTIGYLDTIGYLNKIDDELFNEIVDRIKRFTEKRDAIPPKNRPTADIGSAYE